MQTEQFISNETTTPQYVSWEEYMDKYADDRYEWVEGNLIPMTPVNIRHNDIAQFLEDILTAYCALAGGGKVLREEIVMKLENISSRETY